MHLLISSDSSFLFLFVEFAFKDQVGRTSDFGSVCELVRFAQVEVSGLSMPRLPYPLL